MTRSKRKALNSSEAEELRKTCCQSMKSISLIGRERQAFCNRHVGRGADEFAEMGVLAAIRFKAITQRDNSNAVGSRPGGGQTRLTTLDASLVKRAHASLGDDLYRFNHGFIRESRLNRQYHIDGMKRRRRLLKRYSSRVSHRKSVAAAHRSKAGDVRTSTFR